ncbi:hypothetical protein ACFLT9_00720 [Acidobacteriota bacterium]
MTFFSSSKRKWGMGLVRIVVLIGILSALILSGELSGFYYGSGLIFLLIGGFVSLFMGFSPKTIGSALRHAFGKPGTQSEIKTSIYFWEAASRNFILVGVLGTLIHFIIQMMFESQGIAHFFTMFARSFLSTLYGLLFGVGFMIPTLKIKKGQAEGISSISKINGESEDLLRTSKFGFTHLAGYAVFITLLGWTILSAPSNERWSALDWFIHLPAILIVVGGTLAISLFIGKFSDGETITVSFAFTGLIGSLMGLVQTLHGMTEGSVQSIASAVAFIMSSCFLALVGMVLVGIPLEDRNFVIGQHGHRQKISRIAWYGFPLLAIIFLIFCLVLIVTPIKK